MSVTAPVKISGELDPAAGDIAFADAQVQNNSVSMDVVADSASFHAADGVSGDWKATLGGEAAQLPLDGTDAILGVEIGREESSALSLDTTFSGSAAGKMVDKPLGSLTLTFSEKKEAFAVYSDDDKSLTFYKRGTKPAAGSVYGGKAATEVYTGFETDAYKCIKVGSRGYDYDEDAIIDTPWFGMRNDIDSVSVQDAGIRPQTLQYWFMGLSNCTSFYLNGLDTSRCSSLLRTFAWCKSATNMQLSEWNVSGVAEMCETFLECHQVESLDLSGWSTPRNVSMHSTWNNCYRLRDVLTGEGWDTSGVNDIACAFMGTAFSRLDLSMWNTSSVECAYKAFYNCRYLCSVSFGISWKWVGDDGFLPAPSSEYISEADGRWYDAATGDSFTPAEVPAGNGTYVAVNPKTAFAVYSADDGSLDFYKRMSAPAVGDTFEGKTVNKVYTGFETAEYGPVIDGDNNGDVNTPWYGERDAIANVAVIDAGIRPKSMKFWFQHLGSLKSIEGLAKLDTSQVVSFQHAFHATSSLSKIDVAGLDTSASSSFDACFSKSGIAEIDLSTWRFEKGRSLGWMFAACPNLKTVTMPHSKTASGAWFSCAFQSASSLKTVDMSGLEPINLSDVRHMFDGCASLADIKGIERWDTSSCTTFEAAFWYCSSLQSLDISGWAIHPDAAVGNMFANMASLRRIAVGEGWTWKSGGLLPSQAFDGADGKWYAASNDAAYSPADIPSGKADTYYAVAPSAFAVFSADDGSLDFYKREFAKMPKAGDTFEGKTATEVYTGFENETYTITGYDPSLGNWMKLIASTPWFEVRDSISNIKAVDGGIAPISLRSYFYRFEKVRTIDLTKLDLSRTESIHAAFCCDYKVESISLPGITAAATDSDSAFAACHSLRTVALGPSDFSGMSSFFHMFMDAGSLTLDCSSWNVREDADRDGFNLHAPGVIIPGAWQTAATSEDAATETAPSPAIAVSSNIAPAKSSSSDPWPAATAARAEGPAADDGLLEGAESEQEPPQDTGKDQQRRMGQSRHRPEARR